MRSGSLPSLDPVVVAITYGGSQSSMAYCSSDIKNSPFSSSSRFSNVVETILV